MSVSSSSNHDADASTAPVLIAEKYAVEQEIGKGSFATVYKGRLVSKGEDSTDFIAIKAVSRSKLKNKKLLENLEIEIAILKKIKHPHIVGLMNCERTGSDFFLIMEYCALGDLTFLIKKRKALIEKHPLVRTMFEKYPPPSESHNGLNRVVVVNYLQQLSSALMFLRSKNLVHRDIKPQNLLISTPLINYHDAETFHKMGFVGIYNLPVLKIADFGFARFLPNTSLAETLCGSPLYMAPEILNYQKYNAKADLWSVGTVLYEMCCGRPPFKASNHLELFKKIKKANDVISFPSHCKLEPEMCELICGLLTFDPSQRMGFNEFFSHEIVNEDLSAYEKEDMPDLEDKSKDVAGSNMFISEYLTKPAGKPMAMKPLNEIVTSTARSMSSSDTAKTHDRPRNSSTGDRNEKAIGSLMDGSRAHQDTSIEKEYVMVEKKSVEVNALADEFANLGTRAGSELDRRSPPLKSLQQQVNAPQATAIRKSSSSSGATARRPSLVERRLSISSLSPSNALTKALGIASTRLFGSQHTPALSVSPNQVNQPLLSRQVFHELTENLVLSADHKMVSAKYSEAHTDADIISLLESLAAKAFVISSFAEVKFSQLVPLPPSSLGEPFSKRLSSGSCAIEEEDEHIANEDEHFRSKEAASGSETASSTLRKRNSSENSAFEAVLKDLPPSEVYQLCTEAMVLYMKALSTLAKAMQATSNWWYRSQEKNCSLKLNVLVQWLRDKFNECLERAEFLRLKLISKGSFSADDSTLSASRINGTGAETATASVEEESEPVFLEKLIYDRALEISKTAAKFEMQGEFLNNCELAYATSLWMLETVLDQDTADDNIGDFGFQTTEALDEADRLMIKKYIDSVAKRLKILRRKLNSS
ncbi:LANO_0F08394g1_1 [Lachancea nothofagi CBS 11611]|uniref:Serine/threonine-protein kinase ATG1 n=1 Tax=Lachancea nothofagi CBS 11611 TaxID=1266666 RepID=A0A1G4K9E1_9SACH|nr:LANO_0F08394g1_1 [Lachancea nothofagi CBS 11611]